MKPVFTRRLSTFVLASALVACTATVQPEWVRYYNGGAAGQMNWMSALSTDSNGDILMVGSAVVPGVDRNENLVIAKYTPQGNQSWARMQDLSTGTRISDEQPTDAVTDESGNTYIAGVQYLHDANSSAYASFLTKITGTGEVAWTRSLSNTQDAYDLEWQADRLYVTGHATQVFDADGQQILRIDHADRPAWAIDTDINGEIAVAGRTGVTRYGADGGTRWHLPSQADVEHQADVILHQDGTVTVAQMLIERGAARISHIAADGNLLWQRSYATPKKTYGMPGHALLAEDGRGDLYLVSSNSDARRMVKLDRSGREYWNVTRTSGIVQAMDVSANGALFLVGNGANEKLDSNGKLIAEAPTGGVTDITTGALTRHGDNLYVGYSFLRNNTYEFYLALYKDQ